MKSDNTRPDRKSSQVAKERATAERDLKRAKAFIAAQIAHFMKKRGLTLRQAEALSGFTAADFSRVRNADLARFTLDRLIRMLKSLTQDFEVVIQLVPQRRDSKTIAKVSGNKSATGS